MEVRLAKKRWHEKVVLVIERHTYTTINTSKPVQSIPSKTYALLCSSAPLYSKASYCTVLYCAVVYGTLLYSNIMYCTIMCCYLLFFTVLSCE